jgi:hypothetical protein
LIKEIASIERSKKTTVDVQEDSKKVVSNVKDNLLQDIS